MVVASSGKVVPGGGTNDFDVSRFHDDAPATLSLPASTPASVAYTPTSVVVSVSLSRLAEPGNGSVRHRRRHGRSRHRLHSRVRHADFAPGVTSQPVTIALLGNLYAEPSKSFTLTLSNPAGATISGGTGTIQLANNNAPAWTNPVNALDVNGDGQITPIDALDIINHLDSSGQGTLGTAPEGADNFFDVDGNGSCTPLDVLKVINYLNAHAAVASPAVASGTAATSEQTLAAADAGGDAASSTAVVLPAIAVPTIAAPVAAGPSPGLADVAFALAAGAPPATSSASGSVWTPSSGSDDLSPAAAASNPPAPGATATTDPAGSAEDWSSKTDVEDLLDLLA